MRRDERLNARNLSSLFARGWSAARAARHYGVSVRTAQVAAVRHDLTRWDAPGVLISEIAVRYGVSSDAVIKQARAHGLPLARWRDLLLLSTADAAVLHAYFARQHPAEDYAHWLTAEQTAARLGISVVAVSAAVGRGTPWAVGLIRVKVRTRTRWAYRYCPRSVEAAKVRRGK